MYFNLLCIAATVTTIVSSFELVTNDEVISNVTKQEELITTLLTNDYSPILFENVELKLLNKVLTAGGFAFSPNEERDYLMVHSYAKGGFKYFHTKEYMHFKATATIKDSTGTVNSVDEKAAQKGPLFDEFMQDVSDYSSNCGRHADISQCESYVKEWNRVHNFADNTGMVPSNAQAFWGELKQIVYLDSTATTFTSIIPFYVYLYGESDSKNALQDILIYIVADGIHSQDPECNSAACRGFAHRDLWINITAQPTAPHNSDQYRWVYSRPTSSSGLVRTNTDINDDHSLGLSATYQGESIHLGGRANWKSLFNQSVVVTDFNVVQSQPNQLEGEWNYYQATPVNILQYPYQQFASNYKHWYNPVSAENSEEPETCNVIAGPVLALNSQQTSNAIKWQVAPSMIDYHAHSLNVKYSVHLQSEVATLWCPNYNGYPPSVCTPGAHCVKYSHVWSHPSWTSNLLKAMNIH